MVRVHAPRARSNALRGERWLRSREEGYNGDTPNIDLVGVERNIATFHDNITKGEFADPTWCRACAVPDHHLGRAPPPTSEPKSPAQTMRTAEKWQFDTKGLKGE